MQLCDFVYAFGIPVSHEAFAIVQIKIRKAELDDRVDAHILRRCAHTLWKAQDWARQPPAKATQQPGVLIPLILPAECEDILAGKTQLGESMFANGQNRDTGAWKDLERTLEVRRAVEAVWSFLESAALVRSDGSCSPPADRASHWREIWPTLEKIPVGDDRSKIVKAIFQAVQRESNESTQQDKGTFKAALQYFLSRRTETCAMLSHLQGCMSERVASAICWGA